MSKFVPLRNALADKGWSISSVELASDCWWANDIWALRSEWSPVGRVVYLIFLIDPHSTHDLNNLPDSDIWAVGLADTIPRNRPVSEIVQVPVRNKFQKSIPKIVELAAAMRTTG